MGSNSIRHCPFCGNSSVSVHNDHENHCYFVQCHNCSTEGPLESSEENAIRYWNVRTPKEMEQALQDDPKAELGEVPIIWPIN